MPELLVVGEALTDIISSPTRQSEHPGGSPMNVAIGLARLGTSVTLATRLGADARGRRIRDHLMDSAVRLAPGSIEPTASTSSATATIAADGSATYDFDITWDIRELPAPAFDVIHTGSIGALLAPGADHVTTYYEAAPDEVLRSFDPNIRPSILGPREEVLPLVERLARSSTVVKMSDEDARWLHPDLDPTDVTTHYARLGADIIVVTMGAQGSMLRVGAHTTVIPSEPVDVVDTIGAGDSYMAGLLFGLTTFIGTKSVIDRTAAFDDIERAARFAASCAAITVSRPGANLPRGAEMSLPSPRPERDRR